MVHVMLDLETLGKRAGCTILSIGAVEFGPDGVGRNFYQVIGSASCVAVGLRSDPETLAWWQGQGEAARAVLAEAITAPPLGNALVAFTDWLGDLGDAPLVWGNGADFDLPILAAAYAAVGMPVPWAYYAGRCYRTLKSFAPAIPIERDALVHHHALGDAIAQAMHMRRIMPALGLPW